MYKLILSFLLITGFMKPVIAQSDTIYIVTSAVCNMCKKTIENHMSFEKGVKKSILDVDTKILTVIYNPKKTTPEKIRTAVTKSGYDADSLKADPKAFNKLPDCCKDAEHKEHGE